MIANPYAHLTIYFWDFIDYSPRFIMERRSEILLLHFHNIYYCFHS